MNTISGGVFEFNSSYTAPVWGGGATYYFDVDIKLHQIYSTNNYIYAATNVGLRIYEAATEGFYAYVTYSGGFTTIGGNDSNIYIGTTNSGIKTISTTCISGSTNNPYDLGTCLVDLVVPYITSNNIKYLNVNNNKMTVCTSSGVDYFRFSTNPEIHSRTFISSAEKCFTTGNSIYYTVSGTNTTTSGTEYSLNRLDTCLCDWSEPTYSYVTGSGIFESSIKLNDIYITENTVENYNNTVFCATSSGVYVIDEDSKNYAIYYTR